MGAYQYLPQPQTYQLLETTKSCRNRNLPIPTEGRDYQSDQPEGVLGAGKTPVELERMWGVGETTDQKGALGWVKPQKHRKEGGVLGKRPTTRGS